VSGHTAGVKSRLRRIKDLEGYAVGASYGPIGHVKDFYFVLGIEKWQS